MLSRLGGGSQCDVDQRRRRPEALVHFASGSGQVQTVADSHVAAAQLAGCQFHDVTRTHRDREPPRRESRDNLDRAAIAVDEQDVDRKAHERRVNGEASEMTIAATRPPVATKQPLIRAARVFATSTTVAPACLWRSLISISLSYQLSALSS